MSNAYLAFQCVRKLINTFYTQMRSQWNTWEWKMKWLFCFYLHISFHFIWNCKPFMKFFGWFALCLESAEMVKTRKSAREEKKQPEKRTKRNEIKFKAEHKWNEHSKRKDRIFQLNLIDFLFKSKQAKIIVWAGQMGRHQIKAWNNEMSHLWTLMKLRQLSILIYLILIVAVHCSISCFLFPKYMESVQRVTCTNTRLFLSSLYTISHF